MENSSCLETDSRSRDLCSVLVQPDAWRTFYRTSVRPAWPDSGMTHNSLSLSLFLPRHNNEKFGCGEVCLNDGLVCCHVFRLSKIESPIKESKTESPIKESKTESPIKELRVRERMSPEIMKYRKIFMCLQVHDSNVLRHVDDRSSANRFEV